MRHKPYPSTFKHWIKATSLVVAISFLHGQVFLGDIPKAYALRPLALAEVKESNHGLSRRDFLKVVAASMGTIVLARTVKGTEPIDQPIVPVVDINEVLEIENEYPFINFSELIDIFKKYPTMALEIARALQVALKSVDPEIINMAKSRQIPFNNIRLLVRLTSRFVDLSVVSPSGVQLPTIIPLRAIHRTREGEIDTGDIEKLGNAFRQIFFQLAIAGEHIGFKQTYATSLKGLNLCKSYEVAYRVLKGIKNGLDMINSIDDTILTNITSPPDREREIAVYQKDDRSIWVRITGVTLSSPIYISASVAIMPLHLQDILSKEIIAAHIKLHLLPGEDQQIWKQLIVDSEGDAEQQFNRAIRCQLGLRGDIIDSATSRYSSQLEFANSLLFSGVQDASYRRTLVNSQSMPRYLKPVLLMASLTAVAGHELRCIYQQRRECRRHLAELEKLLDSTAARYDEMKAHFRAARGASDV
jgi:hypothetical protein